MTETTTYDVIVVGSGAGGMTAALRAFDQGLSVLLIEKSELYGGTSAMSGGGIWIPNHGKPSSVQDCYDEAFTYMRGLVEPCVSDERIHTYLTKAPVMLRYLEAHTHARFDPQDSYCDYYPDRPGGKSGGRTLDPAPYDGALLDDEMARLRPSHVQTVVMGRYTLTMAEARKVFSKASGWMSLMLKVVAQYWLDWPQRRRSSRSRRLVLGNALVGRLRHSMLDRNIPLWLNTALEELLYEAGRCTGVRVQKNGQPLTLMARKGVILAAGGFERNQAMRDQYLPQPSSIDWSAGNPANTGDAIRAGQKLGAHTDLMAHAWWGPAVKVEQEPLARILFVEKSLPSLIFVNRDGKRFSNEAAPYQNYGASAYTGLEEEGNAVPAYAIFDSQYRKKYLFGPMLQSEVTPDALLPKHLKDNFYHKADSLEALAATLGLPVQNLRQTVDRFNRMAKAGEDTDFHKGGNLHDQYYGDASHSPNPCLGTLSKAPFYAVKVYPGDLGTKGGLLTDTHARVLHENGEVINGLYAIGNCSASVMGSTYPGAGSTLGPAMTFGYLAANHLADCKQEEQLDPREAMSA
ncbi:FAD-dependent oxidoreductase [Aestuariicella hydrocarbonica]|uniref:3-oxosteroid 1-dehydrogenase n=1 Tax=Pseudomaricurvus hydrocarbonicus TaxID=1470433 RepID=A0A9E5MM28_9GAMM|nr:FAD-dependent oxidoreductase [Aestuariicella hydrocarbonica]NHO66113.1 FAD-dependent oxidoreductase [Aestuariicella hydrocarbonica]